MIVRGPEFWGLDLIVSMGFAYVVVLALAWTVTAVRRGLHGGTSATRRASTRRRSSVGVDG